MQLFKNIFSVIRRELRLFVSYRTFSVLSVGLPLLALLFFLVLFGKGVPRDLPIAIMDSDNSPLSRKLISMIDATPTVRVAYDITDMTEGENLMKQGKIDAIVIIPREMERDIYRGRQADVAAYINGANVTKNGLLDKDIRTALYTFSSGIQIQTLVKKGISEKQAYDMMMPIYFEKHVLFNPYTNYAYYLLPIFMPMMILIFVLLTTIFTIGVELKNGTAAEWLKAANGDVFAAYLGKILPYTIIFLILITFSNTLMYDYVGIPLKGSKEVLMVSNLLFVMAYQALGVVIVALLGNLRLALSIGGGYSVLAFTFSGLTFPLMAMSLEIQVISHVFPLTYYMKIFIDQAMRGAPVFQSIIDMGYIAIFILLPLPLLPRLKKLCSDEKYWGKM